MRPLLVNEIEQWSVWYWHEATYTLTAEISVAE